MSRVGGDLQLLHRQVRQRARPRRTIGQLARIRLHVGHEFLQRIHRHRRRDDQDVRRAADHRNGREVLHRVVGELAHRGIGPVRADVADHQRVAIGCRARRGHRPDHSPAAALVLDDDGLSERPAQAVGDGARDQVDATAGLHRRDDLDRLVRVTALRECARDKRCGGDAGQHAPGICASPPAGQDSRASYRRRTSRDRFSWHPPASVVHGLAIIAQVWRTLRDVPEAHVVAESLVWPARTSRCSLPNEATPRRSPRCRAT